MAKKEPKKRRELHTGNEPEWAETPTTPESAKLPFMGFGEDGDRKVKKG